MESPDGLNPLDRATADRLRRLGSMPVETARVEAWLRATLGEKTPAAQPKRMRLLKPLLAVAATLVLGLGTAALVLGWLARPATASADDLVKFHEELVSGRTVVMKVDSIDEASRVLSAQWPEMPALPDMPKGHDMACCMKSVKDKKMACVLLRQGDIPLTLVVARAADVKAAGGTSRHANGMDYRIHPAGKLNMLTCAKGDRVICLIGEVSEAQLATVAQGLKF